jgi:hypothetical protein
MVFRSASLVFALGLLVSTAHAHAGGQTFEQRVGEMFIDAGYDVPLTVGQSSMFDLQLFQMKGKDIATQATYDSVRIQLFSGSVVQLEASTPKAEFGKTVISIMPTMSGNWNLHIQFMGKEITSSTFDVFILAQTKKVHAWPIVLGVIVMGILLDVFFIKAFKFVPGVRH